MIAHDFYNGDYTAKARFVGEIIDQLHLILCHAKTSVNSVNLYESVKHYRVAGRMGLLSQVIEVAGNLPKYPLVL